MPAQNHESSPQGGMSPSPPTMEEFPCVGGGFSMAPTQMLSSPPSASIFVGDCIGCESCLDLKTNEDVLFPKVEEEETSDDRQSCGGLNRSFKQERLAARRVVNNKREFPPPIPLLARTENLPSHMPWVLKRHYTSDGRLILTEEKVRHHEYFRAHRCNGRLTLQLIPLDDDAPPSSSVAEDHERENDEQLQFEEEEEKEEDGGKNVCNGCVYECEECGEDGDNKDSQKEELEYDDRRFPAVETSGNGGMGSSGKCFNYNSVRPTSTSIFGVPVPALRPVQG